ncbi:hypothetical protein MMC07_000295 [Pseudocyphellaria aurata]|nr:hypothetical protein [Pseudocyphellaria aurata]
MSLSDLLEAEFLNTYIKTGNILMISDGRPGVDNFYTLKDGSLRLELNKESYESCGLNGTPVRDGGRKHIKSRYAVEIDLQSSSMLHGKKGFERVRWAFTNVLLDAVTWLFYDFHDQNEKDGTQSIEAIAPSRKPIAAHHPIVKTCAPKTTLRERVVQPYITIKSAEMAAMLEAKSIELHEWLGLNVLGSPRIQEDDSVDPYLCRYAVPDDGPIIVSGVVTMQWSGLIPASWIRQLLVELIGHYLKHEKRCNNPWFALSSHAFRTEAVNWQDGYTILRAPTGDTVEKAHGTALETVQPDLVKSTKEEYLLWEFSQVSNGRS